MAQPSAWSWTWSAAEPAAACLAQSSAGVQRSPIGGIGRFWMSDGRWLLQTSDNGRRERQIQVCDELELFVDDRGWAGAPALLHIHGGPGQGCWDFMFAQGELLARHLRVVGVDQRGCLRSDDAPMNELDQATLVRDYEVVRRALGVGQWTILGHSAGGPTVLEYVSRHPESVQAVILDNAVVDGEASTRHRMRKVASLFELQSRSDLAARARGLAGRPEPIVDPQESIDLMHQLGGDYMSQFFHSDGGLRAWRAVMSACDLEPSLWERDVARRPACRWSSRPDRHAREHRAAVFDDVGESDPITTPRQVEAHRGLHLGQQHCFPATGHFAFLERPQEYAEVLTTWIAGLVAKVG
ncbi:hypothetical protein CGZ92_12520 [Parenemella sanctibonifatiensis]|uniref:prolyl aminopeptidase n=2 Tax=Parenemella sanctibonifatiensis TaxID=2016505 RepID=A0A255DZZ1_9ACTN|nr:hypothetical protein CGZ92_12520 [Parenemella sanctibonifatiensis]